jgi:hypothetical protein
MDSNRIFPALLNILSWFWMTIDGALNWKLDILTTYRVVTKINCMSITNLHTLQLTTAPAKSFQPDVSSPVVPW